MTETGEVVLYEVAEGIAQITLNRPEALNAWTPGLGSAYFDRLEEADADERVRVIIVTGAGRGFCAGADLSGTRDPGPGAERPRPRSGQARSPDQDGLRNFSLQVD